MGERLRGEDADVVAGWKVSGAPVEIVGKINDVYHLARVSRAADCDGFVVHGQLRTFEAVGQVEVVDERGHPMPLANQVGPGHLVIHASEGAPAWGGFCVKVCYPASLRGKVATLTFYVSSPKDGSRQDAITLQVRLELRHVEAR